MNMRPLMRNPVATEGRLQVGCKDEDIRGHDAADRCAGRGGGVLHPQHAARDCRRGSHPALTLLIAGTTDHSRLIDSYRSRVQDLESFLGPLWQPNPTYGIFPIVPTSSCAEPTYNVSYFAYWIGADEARKLPAGRGKQPGQSNGQGSAVPPSCARLSGELGQRLEPNIHTLSGGDPDQRRPMRSRNAVRPRAPSADRRERQ